MTRSCEGRRRSVRLWAARARGGGTRSRRSGPLASQAARARSLYDALARKGPALAAAGGVFVRPARTAVFVYELAESLLRGACVAACGCSGRSAMLAAR